MKRLLAIVSLSLLGYVSGDSDSLSGIFPEGSWLSEVESTSRAQQIKVGDPAVNCTAVYSCEDCTTARVCRPVSAGGFQLLQTIKCSGARPFCDPNSGSCVAQEPESCGAKDDSFVCMGNGRYPDTNCTRFHACLDYQSVTFQCAVEGETYNPRTQSCEPSSSCGQFDCAGNLGRKVPHSSHGGYFAFCKADSGPIIIDSCPGNYELNITSQACEPICHAEGIVQDVTDCHYYYKCTHIFISPTISYMKRDRLKCPAGQAYSTKEFLCVDEKNVPDCTR